MGVFSQAPGYHDVSFDTTKTGRQRRAVQWAEPVDPLGCLAYLSIQLARVQFFGGSTYTLTAVFPTVSRPRNGASVEIAGVTVGHVQGVELDGFDAVVTLRVRKGVEFSKDAIVSIRTRGLIGEKYLRVSQGADERSIPAAGRVREVEPPLDFEEMISQLIQGKI